MEFRIPVSELARRVSDATDLIERRPAGHQSRVARVAVALGEASKLPQQRLADLYPAALLHDVGAMTAAERLAIAGTQGDVPMHHAELSRRLLSTFQPFEQSAQIVRYHHRRWDGPDLSAAVPAEVLEDASQAL